MKRLSREGHELNGKMGAEMADTVAKLSEQAVRSRDASWSDYPGDRNARGKSCGGGLGVCLGVASAHVGDGKATAEERMEAMLDLHGLHSNEAMEVLKSFCFRWNVNNFMDWHTQSWVKKSTLGRRILPMAPCELVWQRVFVRGISLSFEILMHLQGQGRSKKESKRMRCR